MTRLSRPLWLILAVWSVLNAQSANGEYEQWQFSAPYHDSEVFPTEQAAADHMRSFDSQYLTVRGPIVQMSQGSVDRIWSAPDEPPFYTSDWVYEGSACGNNLVDEDYQNFVTSLEGVLATCHVCPLVGFPASR